MSQLSSVRKALAKACGIQASCREENGAIIVEGHVGSWEQVHAAGKAAAGHGYRGVVNLLTCDGVSITPPRSPQLRDSALEGKRVDVLVIGGGVIGAAILRELSRWNMTSCLIEKEADLAMHQSSRNAGNVHPAFAPSPGSLKAIYNTRANPMFPQLADELGVPFSFNGMMMLMDRPSIRFAYPILAARARRNSVGEFRYLTEADARKMEPYLGSRVRGAFYMPRAGMIDPFMLTIAQAENAVENGSEVWLSTMATGIRTEPIPGKPDARRIAAVETNRGTIFPSVVVNAAGLWADRISEMAGDRFFTIHPRRGEMIILDKKVGHLLHTTASMPDLLQASKDTKGGGVIPTIDGNILLGPDAHEVPQREDYSTSRANIDTLFAKHRQCLTGFSTSDAITYFAGNRAATYDEDFIIETSPRVSNLVQAAGIQSPGLTAAPAIAQDVAKMCIAVLRQRQAVAPNERFNPRRNSPPDFARMSFEERQRVIKSNPEYGVVVCRCEVVSEGELRAALRSPIPPTTMDGLKRRVRTGMGRCQGGFCSPLVMEIIQDELGIAAEAVTKKGDDSAMIVDHTRPRTQAHSHAHGAAQDQHAIEGGEDCGQGNVASR